MADTLNRGLLRLFRSRLDIQLLGQIHDAVVFQYPEQFESIIIPQAIEILTIPTPVNGRTLTIPADAQVGYNWAHFDPKKKLFPDGNPDGLKKWKPGEKSHERRLVGAEETSLLDGRLY